MVATGDLVESVRGLAEQAGWLSELNELETEGKVEERGTKLASCHVLVYTLPFPPGAQTHTHTFGLHWKMCV